MLSSVANNPSGLTTRRGCKGKQPDPGDHSGGDTPLPIPNRAVKPANADGTTWETLWESRSSPGFSSKSLLDQSIGKALSFWEEGGGNPETAVIPRARPSTTRRRESRMGGVVRGGYGEILHFVQNDGAERSTEGTVIPAQAGTHICGRSPWLRDDIEPFARLLERVNQ